MIRTLLLPFILVASFFYCLTYATAMAFFARKLFKLNLFLLLFRQFFVKAIEAVVIVIAGQIIYFRFLYIFTKIIPGDFLNTVFDFVDLFLHMSFAMILMFFIAVSLVQILRLQEFYDISPKKLILALLASNACACAVKLKVTHILLKATF